MIRRFFGEGGSFLTVCEKVVLYFLLFMLLEDNILRQTEKEI